MGNKEKKPLIILRALLIFVVLALVLVVVHYLSYHHYADVAEWKTQDSREVLVYSGEEYLLSDKHGGTGLAATKYKMQRTEGEVKIEDFKTSLFNVILVASVTDYEDLLVVTYEDGDKYVYYRSGTENPADPVNSDGSNG